MSEKEEKIDLEKFRKKFGFMSIPNGGVILCRNTVTGGHKIKASGLRFLHLWQEYKYVSTKNLTLDYPTVTLKVKDGFDVIIDPAIDTVITDPIKYEENCIDPINTSAIMLAQLLKSYVSTKTYEELTGLILSTNNPDYVSFFKPKFDEFNSKYGLEFGNLYLKSVDLTKIMKDDYEKKAVQQKENERKLIEVENKKKLIEIEKDIAKEEAMISRLKLTPFEKSMNEIVKMLQKQGLDNNQIKDALCYYVATRGESDTKFISVGNNSEMLNAALINSLNGKSK